MARTPASQEDNALRHKAFELYTSKDKDGNVRSLKSIAIELGISQPRLGYWVKTDRWLEKAREIHTLSATPDPDDIRLALRINLGRHLNTLSGIIEGTAHDRVRVQAIRDYAMIAKQLGAMDILDAPTESRQDKRLEFDDTIEPQLDEVPL